MATRELTCKELVEVVTDYLESRMPADERVRFEQHLVYCAPCRAYVEQMRETIRLTGTLREEDVPAEGRESLLRVFRDWKQNA
jgi:predicted anti-sigma-YlaC factor YlaD